MFYDVHLCLIAKLISPVPHVLNINGRSWMYYHYGACWYSTSIYFDFVMIFHFIGFVIKLCNYFQI